MQYCLNPKCSTIVKRGYCPKCNPHRESQRFNVDVRRWYRTARWRALAASVRAEQPICRDDIGDGRSCGRPTTDVDHVQPHGGDPELFWNPANLRARCHGCHSAKTLREHR